MKVAYLYQFFPVLATRILARDKMLGTWPVPYEIRGLLHIASLRIQVKGVLIGNRLRPQARLRFQM